jgi:hypothetical protein
MIKAGATVYEAWEENHIFGDYTPPSDYAVRELVEGRFSGTLTPARLVQYFR